MHAAVTILQKIARPVSEHVDVRNVRNLLLAAQALVSGRRLVLMELARHWPGAQRVLGPLKRLDRLLGNDAVHQVRERFYQMAAAWLLRCEQPVLIVDWSELKRDGRWHLLRAGVPMRGRTMTVYEEVHPEGKKNSRKVQARFLRRLKALLPAGIRPIIVTDAGFQNPWFKTVEKLRWHWIGRVRNRTRVRLAGAPQWICCSTLHDQSSTNALSLGEAYLAASNPCKCHLVLVRRCKRGRVQLTRYGKRAQSGHSRDMARSTKEPWLLAAACSLNEPAASIVSLYAKRMQIEQSFRDLKSHRYGCAFEDTLTRSAERLEMLLLIHMLASLASWLVGLTATTHALARVCTDSLLKRYSVLWLGWACLRHGPPKPTPLASSLTYPKLLLAATA